MSIPILQFLFVSISWFNKRKYMKKKNVSGLCGFISTSKGMIPVTVLDIGQHLLRTGKSPFEDPKTFIKNKKIPA
jgi:hypothetical protein